jgi:hypothetical protein
MHYNANKILLYGSESEISHQYRFGVVFEFDFNLNLLAKINTKELSTSSGNSAVSGAFYAGNDIIILGFRGDQYIEESSRNFDKH